MQGDTLYENEKIKLFNELIKRIKKTEDFVNNTQTESFVFVLEDNTEVTKNIVCSTLET